VRTVLGNAEESQVAASGLSSATDRTTGLGFCIGNDADRDGRRLPHGFVTD